MNDMNDSGCTATWNTINTYHRSIETKGKERKWREYSLSCESDSHPYNERMAKSLSHAHGFSQNVAAPQIFFAQPYLDVSVSQTWGWSETWNDDLILVFEHRDEGIGSQHSDRAPAIWITEAAKIWLMCSIVRWNSFASLGPPRADPRARHRHFVSNASVEALLFSVFCAPVGHSGTQWNPASSYSSHWTSPKTTSSSCDAKRVSSFGTKVTWEPPPFL